MCDLVLLLGFVMSVIMVLSRDAVSSVEHLGSLTLITVKNVQLWKKTEMDAPKLSIWVAPRQIYFMNVKNTVLKSDEMDFIKLQKKKKLVELCRYTFFLLLPITI